MRIWAQLRDIVAAEEKAVLVSVLGTRGSAPREAGARMIVSDAGLRGTIGGGTLEYQAWQRALALLQSDAPQAALSTHLLGPDLGQCCGGQVVLGFEYFSKANDKELLRFTELEKTGFAVHTHYGDAPCAQRLVIEPGDMKRPVIRQGPSEFIEYFDDAFLRVQLFGAGHVGQALVLALAPLPFHILWHDQRREAFPRLNPPNVEIRSFASADGIEFLENDLVIIMTHSHSLDLDLTAAALRSPARFVGLIGSATKKARFMSRLKMMPLSPSDRARLVCPLGVSGIDGKEPAIIAASIAAQLLLERSKIKEFSKPSQHKTDMSHPIRAHA